MQNEILYSLKPEYVNLILNKEKNHEFRSVKPKILPSRIWFYITKPVFELTYLAEVEKIVFYPDKILIYGVGNNEFNTEGKSGDFAYQIKNLYKINKPLSLGFLKQKFNFTAPQGFSYLSKYPDLYEYVLNNIGIEKIY
jgi:predicted transcriptional regulator